MNSKGEIFSPPLCQRRRPSYSLLSGAKKGTKWSRKRQIPDGNNILPSLFPSSFSSFSSYLHIPLGSSPILQSSSFVPQSFSSFSSLLKILPLSFFFSCLHFCSFHLFPFAFFLIIQSSCFIPFYLLPFFTISYSTFIFLL